MPLFPTLFGLVIFYAPISLIVNYLLGNSKFSLQGIFEEVRLWLGFSALFIGIYFILFLGVHTAPPVWLIFMIYTVAYFVLSVFRKMVWNDSKDLFAKEKANA